MSETIIVALLSLLGSLGGTLGGIALNSKLSNYRIEQLEKKVDKHNNLIERMFRAEEAINILYKSLSANPKVMSPLAAQLLAIAQAFNNRGTVTVNGTSHNYEGKTGKIEFLLGGHTHADYDEVINGIPCVLTTQVKPSSASAATFDLVCVDYSAGKLKMIRIGDGSNREFSLSA